MSKTKQPLLSLEAHGSIADTLTYQRRKGVNYAREKPRLPYFLTLPVQYQRWLYEDYCYLWRQQSASVRQAYASSGSRHHLTGFQYWMKDMLTRLPDIAGMWRLDEKAGNVAHDASRNANNGTIVGASPATGLIAGAQSFDGINDYVSIPYSPTLDAFTTFTIEMFIYPTAYGFPTFNRDILEKGYALNGCIYIYLDIGVAARIRSWVRNDAGVWGGSLNLGITALDTWYTLHLVWDGSTICLYINNVAGTNPAFVGTLTITKPVILGGSLNDFKGIMDHVVIYNRALDTTERQRHMERRWPQ